MSVTLEQVQSLADQLTPLDKARLAAHLNTRLASELATSQQPGDSSAVEADAWTRLQAFRRDIEALGAAAPNFAAQLDEDRRTRQVTLEGTGDVYP
jgi:hypothetical protein